MPLSLAQLDCFKSHFKGLHVPSQLLGAVCALTGAPPVLEHLSEAAAGSGQGSKIPVGFSPGAFSFTHIIKETGKVFYSIIEEVFVVLCVY